MKRLAMFFVGAGLLMLVGCESAPSSADDAAMRKRLGNGPPTIPGAPGGAGTAPKGARQDERMAEQGQKAPAGR
jgi:hypothetical protein